VLRSQEIVHKLFADVGPRMADRPAAIPGSSSSATGSGDAAEMVYLELVDYEP
jgi:Ribosomal protein L17